MNSDKLKAACLAATLATAWLAPAPEADAGVVTTSTYYARSSTSLTYLSLAVRVVGMGSGSGGGYQYADLGPMDGGVQDRTFILDGGNPVDRFVTMGLLTNMSLFVSMPDSSSAVGIEFSDLFPGFDENALRQDLMSGGTSSTFDAFVTHLDEKGPVDEVVDACHNARPGVRCSGADLCDWNGDGNFGNDPSCAAPVSNVGANVRYTVSQPGWPAPVRVEYCPAGCP